MRLALDQRIDFPFHLGADVDYQVERLAGAGVEAISFDHGLGPEAGFKMFLEIALAAGQQAGIFHRAAGCLVVGILLSEPRRVKRDHRVCLEHAQKQDEPAADLRGRNLIHAMRAVVQVEDIFKAQDRGHLEVLLLVAQDVLGDGVAAVFLIVGRPHEVARIALANQLGAETAGVIGHVVQMGVYGYENPALVRLPWPVLLDNDLSVAGPGCRLVQKVRAV